MRNMPLKKIVLISLFTVSFILNIFFLVFWVLTNTKRNYIYEPKDVKILKNYCLDSGSGNEPKFNKCSQDILYFHIDVDYDDGEGTFYQDQRRFLFIFNVNNNEIKNGEYFEIVYSDGGMKNLGHLDSGIELSESRQVVLFHSDFSEGIDIVSPYNQFDKEVVVKDIGYEITNSLEEFYNMIEAWNENPFLVK
ncbi:hypothetical protein JW710_02395 [Candidatus Dojkabacteria bacterium]|nr:hypothetical protein [Candidatus Dojkabacteria bacterium]